MLKYLRTILTIVVVCLLATIPVGSARADDGDSHPGPPPGSTDPSFTGHDTTFDHIAPIRAENASSPGGYIRVGTNGEDR